MKSPLFLPSLLTILVCAVLLAASATQAQGPQISSAPIPQADVGTAFTYQGRLEDASGPVNGACDLTFTLWDDPTAGTQIGSDVVDTLTLDDGYFAISLDFGDVYDGRALYLWIMARCPSAQGNYTPLFPRVTLSAAPYAHSLRPGANIQGNNSTPVLHVTNLGTGDGLRASSSSPNFTQGGLSGYNSSSGSGVRGESVSGIGVYAKGSLYGVYSEGNLFVDGELSWLPVTSFIAIPATAFTPESNPAGYNNYGSRVAAAALYPNFYAPVQLPHGATLTGMQFHWYDVSATDNATCTLYVDSMGISIVDYPIAQVVSSGSGGAGGQWTLTIDPAYATVDNEQYIYCKRSGGGFSTNANQNLTFS